MGTSALTMVFAALVVHALDASAAAVQVAHDGARELIRNADFNMHDRLQQRGLRDFHCLPERNAPGHLE